MGRYEHNILWFLDKRVAERWRVDGYMRVVVSKNGKWIDRDCYEFYDPRE